MQSAKFENYTIYFISNSSSQLSCLHMNIKWNPQLRKQFTNLDECSALN